MNRTHRNRLLNMVFEAANEVHKNLGTGIVDTVYRSCFLQELRSRNILFKKDVSFPIYYKGIKLDSEIKIDLLIENEIIVQILTVEKITKQHESHLLTLLKMSNKKTGCIFNFNEPRLVDGFKKIVINE